MNNSKKILEIALRGAISDLNDYDIWYIVTPIKDDCFLISFSMDFTIISRITYQIDEPLTRVFDYIEKELLRLCTYINYHISKEF